MKQCHDSFDDYKFPLTASKTLNNWRYYVVTIDACGRVQILQTQKKLFFLQAVRCFLGVQLVCQVKGSRIVFYAAFMLPRNILLLAFYYEDVS